MSPLIYMCACVHPRRRNNDDGYPDGSFPTLLPPGGRGFNRLLARLTLTARTTDRHCECTDDVVTDSFFFFCTLYGPPSSARISDIAVCLFFFSFPAPPPSHPAASKRHFHASKSSSKIPLVSLQEEPGGHDSGSKPGRRRGFARRSRDHSEETFIESGSSRPGGLSSG